MIRKIIPILIVLIISVACLSLVSADNSTNDTNATEEIEDMANYITPTSIIGDKIEFSDGFTGFSLDSSKKVANDDKFTSMSTSSSENDVKLAIIECYKQHKEDEIANVIAKVLAKDTSNPVAQEVLGSSEQIADHTTVQIDNTTEATFDFELLKSAGDGADCIGFKVSKQTVIPEDTVAQNDTNESVETVNDTTNNETVNNETIDNKTADNETVNNETIDNKTAENETINNETIDNKTAENETIDNETVDNKTADNETVNNETVDNETIIKETNKTIINKTNTVIIKENNTKVITKTNDTPQNATIQKILNRAVGNPIFILAVVILIIAVIGVAVKKR